MAKKKNSAKKVQVVNQLSFSNGVVVKTFGKGKLKDKNVRVTQYPASLFSEESISTTYVLLGRKEMIVEKHENGLRVV